MQFSIAQPINKKILISLFSLILFLSAIGFAINELATSEIKYYTVPCLVTVAIFAVFSLILRDMIGENLFGEIGFLYLGLAVIYTILPALALLLGNLNQDDQLGLLLPSPSEIGAHLWRHALFVLGVAVSYIFLRGRKVPILQSVETRNGNRRIILVLTVMIGACVFLLLFFSAPVNSYYDHYARYDHLPQFVRKLVSIILRLNQGFYLILLVFLFLNFEKYKILISMAVLMLCSFETVYSYGSRIQSLIILLEATCLYHLTVKKISLKKGAIVCICLGVIFSIVELFRTLDFNISSAKDAVATDGLKSASEFGAVFFTGFHLYSERAKGVLPPTVWPMFFNDITSLFTFNDFTSWNPQYWYAENYYPHAAVPPFTLGPIADSAIWGGEIDLLLRGLVNGAFFAYIVRWFIRYKDRWWGLAIYIYCYATCVMTLKYSVFYVLNPLVKTVLPALLAVTVIKKLTLFKKYKN